jgi:DNA-binding NtrC family response regulator
MNPSEPGARTVVVVSVDAALRSSIAASLARMRWQVFEAGTAAAAMEMVEAHGAEAMVLDGWLPDLEVHEFAGHVRLFFPGMDVLRVDGMEAAIGIARSPRRNELLHAIREAAREGASELAAVRVRADGPPRDGTVLRRAVAGVALPEMVGAGPAMQELAAMVRLVGPRTTTVLLEGETGTGKEVAARALHRLSPRAGRPLVVMNCAAIPETLLESELFGHVRGAFTGAVQARVGRIEAANGGTLLLDEIGELALSAQAKMLRFLESGELQRLGENETTRMDVRVIAATHQPLERRAAEGTFRLDLYHRLAVFPIEVPALRERMEDLPALAEHFLARLAGSKRLTAGALTRLAEHTWPGNVRELMHVLERGAILAGDAEEIGADEIRVRRKSRE